MKNNNTLRLFFLFLSLFFFCHNLKSQSAHPDTVALYFAGDVTFANHFEQDIGDRFSYPFAKMKWFGDADISMINLENPLTTRGTPVIKEYNFQANPKYVKVLTDAGVDIVNLANNHIYDYGDDGVFDTIEYLDSAGIKHVGAGRNFTTACQPVLFTVKTLRVAYFGYFDSIKTMSLHFASDSEAGPVNFNLEYLKNDIAAIRESVDVIIVNVHWGIEKSHEVQERQIALAHEAIDAGADVIVGHHPHVLQGVERYKGKIIAYSLGNFIFGGNSHDSYSTAALKISIPVRFPKKIHANIIPLYVRHWQPHVMTGAGAKHLLYKMKKYSEIFPDHIFRKN